MRQKIKKLAKAFLPPIFFSGLRGLWQKTGGIGFYGNYQSWQEAQAQCDGYDAQAIFEKCKQAALQVRDGNAVYERDSVLFEKKEYSWPLLAALLWIASKNGNCLKVLDFGGSFGTSYYQNRDFLGHLEKFSWNIVEQRHFVECGKELFEDEHLGFCYTIQEAVEKDKPHVVLFSSVLQYLPEPYKLLEEIFAYGIEHILVDLTGFIEEEDRIAIQRVPASIYKASYPVWFFNEEKFLKFFDRKYRLVESFPGYVGSEIYIDNHFKAGYKGFIFQEKVAAPNSNRA